MVKIEIRDSRNIREAIIEVPFKKKTIILANNGTGKSSIVKTLENTISNENIHNLKSLNPDITGEPSCVISRDFKKIMIFDNNFASNILFKSSNLLQSDDAYEIFYEDDKLKNLKKVTEDMLNDFVSVCHSNLLDYKKTLDKFAKITSGSKINIDSKKFVPLRSFMGLNEPNPIISLSKDNSFEKLISQIENKADWIKWRKKHSLITIENELFCPFCSQHILDDFISSIDLLESSLNEKAMVARQDLSKLISEISEVANYNFDPFIGVINRGSSIDSVTVNEAMFRICNNSREMVLEIDKIEKLKSSNMFDIDNPLDLSNIKISKFKYLKNYDVLKESFEELKKRKQSLDKIINNSQKMLLEKINESEKILNDFSESIGLPYYFKVEDKNNKKHLIMKYNGTDSEITKPDTLLSYGETNALASILFGIIAKNSKTDLIILDDPFSSFDSFKSHFVYKELFRGNSSLLRGKTTIYLTHSELELHDLIYHQIPTGFDNALILSNKNNLIESKKITKGMIKNYRKSLIDRINQSDNQIVKMIYSRKLIETTYDISAKSKSVNGYHAYQYISSYTKGGELCFINSNKQITPMTKDDIVVCKSKLFSTLADHKIDKFDLNINDEEMISVINQYENLSNLEEKLIFFRYLINRDQNEKKYFDSKDLSISFFLNYVNHFEKDLMLMLSPDIYSGIPNHVDVLINDYYSKLSNYYLSN